MTLSRSLLTLLAPALALALGGCSGDQDRATAEAPPPAVAPELTTLDSEQGTVVPVDRPDWGSDTTSLAVPLPTSIDYPPGYWAIVARDLDAPPAAADAASAPASAAAISAAPAPATAGPASAPAIAGGAPLAPAASVVRAGVLLVPRELRAGSVHDHQGRYLLAMPLAFQPDPGFATPLNRISVAIELAGAGGFGIVTIPRIGVFGLRHGPQPVPDGPVGFAFRADQLDALLRLKGSPRHGGWRLNGYDGGPAPTHEIFYAVLEAPAGARETDAVVRVALHFTPGDEGLVLAQDIHVHIGVGVTATAAAGSSTAKL
jgi:hypothetical protein